MKKLLDFKLKHMKHQESHLGILISKSKGDQRREEHVYLQKAKLDISNDKESRLICRIFKTKSGHKISKTKRISYFRIRGIFKIFKGYILE